MKFKNPAHDLSTYILSPSLAASAVAVFDLHVLGWLVLIFLSGPAVYKGLLKYFYAWPKVTKIAIIMAPITFLGAPLAAHRIDGGFGIAYCWVIGYMILIIIGGHSARVHQKNNPEDYDY